MISTETRPRLAAKVRLRYDRRGERYMLLWPEKGMVLNPTATEIVKLCTGEHTVSGIVERLAEKYPTAPPAALERQVMEFLAAMADRGLMQGDAGAASEGGSAPLPNLAPGMAPAKPALEQSVRSRERRTPR